MNRGVIFASIRRISKTLLKVNTSLRNKNTSDNYSKILQERRSALIAQLIDLKEKYKGSNGKGKNKSRFG